MNAGPRELSFAEAIREALAQAMAADERVFLMGEDIGVYGGAFQVTGDLVHRFGEDRVMDTPIAELGTAGVAVGAAMAGCRPVFEFQFSDFATLAMEQIVNQAAKMRFMLGGRVSVPLVMRLPADSGTGAAAQHSQSLEAWFAHVPGLKVVQPATPHDAKGLLLAAIDDPDPVLIFEHKLLYKMKGEVPQDAYRVPIGQAAIRRLGGDVTIVAGSIMVHKALEAADALAGEGIEAEVIDLRSLRPLDTRTIIKSVKKTSRLACVYEGVKTLGIGAEISAMIAESEAFDHLDAPILRLGGAECPLPYNPVLERAAVPQVPGIIAAVRDLVQARIEAMPVEVILPKVDMDMTEGTIARWHVREGDAVVKGALLFEIETDKAAMEIEAPATGTLSAILVRAGATAPVGSTVATIYAEGEPEGSPIAHPPVRKHRLKAPIGQTPGARVASFPLADSACLRATPLARRLARMNGLRLEGISGSGPQGRILAADVRGRIDRTALRLGAGDAILKFFQPGSFDFVPHQESHHENARRFIQAKQKVPHIRLTVACDLEELLHFREMLSAGAEALPVGACVVKALALALQRVPDAHVTWSERGLHKHRSSAIAVALAGSRRSLVLRQVERKPLSQIATEMKASAERGPDEDSQAATATLVDLGGYGPEAAALILSPPQAVQLAFGAATVRPVAQNGRLMLRCQMTCTLTCDHRAIDGALGATLLAAFRNLIEEPALMLV